MTILPELNIKHQVKTENEIDDYLSIFQDLSQADFALWLMRDPLTSSLKFETVLGVNHALEKYPQLLAWGWNQDFPEMVENKDQLQDFSRWIQEPVYNLMNVPVSAKDQSLGLVQLANFKELSLKSTLEKLANLMGSHLLSQQKLVESNQWASRLQQLLEFLNTTTGELKRACSPCPRHRKPHSGL